MAKDPTANGSISDRAENGEGDDPAAELFPAGTLDGDGKTWHTLFRKGLPTKVTTSLRSAEVPTPRAGLLDPEKPGLLLVSYEYDHPEPVIEWEGEPGDRKAVGLKIRQVIRPYYVERIEKGDLSVLEAQLAAAIKADPRAAASVLDRLQSRMSAELAVA